MRDDVAGFSCGGLGFMLILLEVLGVAALGAVGVAPAW